MKKYQAMVAYYNALVARLRLAGAVDVETPPIVREERGEPAAVEVTVTAPAGKRAAVIHGRGEQLTNWTVVEGQSQTWSVLESERLTVRARDVLEVAHNRDAS